MVIEYFKSVMREPLISIFPVPINPTLFPAYLKICVSIVAVDVFPFVPVTAKKRSFA